jgi:hypothetical protein
MSRLIRLSFLVVATMAMCTTGAFANLPDPGLSDVPDAITLSPGARYVDNPIGGYTVIVNGLLGPVAGSFVEIEISPDADALVSWCVGQVHAPTIITGMTDLNGEVSFDFFGGGCINPEGDFGFLTFIAQVRADGQVLGEPYFVSPDAVNSQGEQATETEVNNCEAGITSVGLSDAVFHTGPIKLAFPGDPDALPTGFCTKMTPEPNSFNDPVDLQDAVFLTPYIKNANVCTCQ